MATGETRQSNRLERVITGAKLVKLLSGYIGALGSLDSERLKGYVSTYAMNRMSVIRYGMVWDAESAFRWFDRSHELYGNDKVAQLLDGLDTFTADFADSILEACHYMKSDPLCMYAVCQLRTTSDPLFVALVYEDEAKCWKILAFFSTPFSGFMDAQSLWHTSVEAAYIAYNSSRNSGLADDESQPSEYREGESEDDDDDDDDYWDQYDKAMNEDEEEDDNNVSIKKEDEEDPNTNEDNDNDDDYYNRYDAVETAIGEDDNNDAQQQTSNNAMTQHIQQSIHSLHNVAKANGMSTLDFHKTVFQVLGNLQ
ncbi:hypothetical protein TRICI_004076 [Trichomonascus ciferrii]|uniref:Uncharacterized protein n=1 Tax=Trichomonascus ciferrii TaxID=44093 RepID=A0A642V237_9ASCO|nr:hypothetical protein TRICI_004076 [Trichomonascus ciferrii]